MPRRAHDGMEPSIARVTGARTVPVPRARQHSGGVRPSGRDVRSSDTTSGSSDRGRQRASLTPKMAIAWSRAPRHILYISVSLAIGAAAAMPIVACSMRDGPDGEPAPPAHAKPDDSTRIPAPPLPPAPAASAQPRAQETSPATSSESEPPGSDVDPFGLHEDDPDAESEVPRRLARGRKGRPIEIVLRSSPPGAVAAVDGVTIGPTPLL